MVAASILTFITRKLRHIFVAWQQITKDCIILNIIEDGLKLFSSENKNDICS